MSREDDTCFSDGEARKRWVSFLNPAYSRL